MKHADVELLRFHALKRIAAGISLAEVATEVNRSKRTLYVWLKAQGTGVDATLKRKMNTGRSLGLTDAQWLSLGRTLERNPEVAGVKAKEWNPSVFAVFVTRVSRKPCNRFLARRLMTVFGYSCVPPEVNLGAKRPRKAGRWEKPRPSPTTGSPVTTPAREG